MSTPAVTPARPRLVCVDDDTPIREGLPHLLPDVDVVATFARVEHLLQRKPAADVLLLDLHLLAPEEEASMTRHGLRGVQAATSAGYRTLIYTNEQRRAVLAVCLAAGASGVVFKTSSMPALRDAVTVVAAGGTVIPTSLAGLVEKYSSLGHLGQLTPRQLEVLRARARGEPFKSIARRLGIEHRTVEDHMYVVTRRFAEYLRTHSLADLEHELGIAPRDLLDPDG